MATAGRGDGHGLLGTKRGEEAAVTGPHDKVVGSSGTSDDKKGSGVGRSSPCTWLPQPPGLYGWLFAGTLLILLGLVIIVGLLISKFLLMFESSALPLATITSAIGLFIVALRYLDDGFGGHPSSSWGNTMTFVTYLGVLLCTYRVILNTKEGSTRLAFVLLNNAMVELAVLKWVQTCASRPYHPEGIILASSITTLGLAFFVWFFFSHVRLSKNVEDTASFIILAGDYIVTGVLLGFSSLQRPASPNL